MFSKTIKIGTRGSKLALWQAHHISDLLQHAGVQSEIVIINTKGDQILDRSLAKIGSKGVFTEELEMALRNGDIDIAQHSAKDVQSHLPDDLELIAFTKREQSNDVVLSLDKAFSLDTPENELERPLCVEWLFFKKYYPHLDVVDMRGNLQTRLEKLQNGHADALALAFAGVHRMGYQDMIVAHLPVEQFTPPVGQGSVAIEASKNMSRSLRDLIRSAMNDEATETCILAERAFLATLNGGCSIPAFCLAQLEENLLKLRGGLVATDGSHEIVFEKECAYSEGKKAGSELGELVLASGGKELLLEIRKQQG